MNQAQYFGPGAARFSTALTPGPILLPRTSLPVFQGTPRHLEAHIRRLETGASAMGRAVPWLGGLRAELTDWLKAQAFRGDQALRMVLDPDGGVLSARLEPLPITPRPYRLAVLPHPLAQRRGDAMVVHKGLAGPWGSGVLAMARQLGAEDALLLWADATLAETAVAAVCVEIDGVLTLPPAEGRVASLAVDLDLPAWAAAKDLRITMAGMSLEQARRGQLWCLNALRGIWPADLL